MPLVKQGIQMLLKFFIRVLLQVIAKFFSFRAASDKGITAESGRKSKTEDSEVSPDESKNNFKIYRHETWYTYCCYLSTNLPDLEIAATKILKTCFARLISLPDGRCAWNSDNGTTFATLHEEDSPGAQETQFRIPETIDPALKYEVAVAAAMRSAERNIYNCNDFPESYARLLLPKIRIWLSDEEATEAKVEIKLFSSGIVLVSLSVAETGDWNLETFIARRVNMNMLPISAVELDSAIAHLIFDAKIGVEAPAWKRWQILRRRHLTRRTNPVYSRDGDQKFIRLQFSAGIRLDSIGLGFVHALAYALGQPRVGWRYLLQGEPKEPRWTGFWSSSPHVHLLSFSDQQTSAKLNEHLHASAFSRLLARTHSDDLRNLPPLKSLRAFDDYGLYINETVILWTYALLKKKPLTKGTKENPFWVPTFHNQSKGEIIEIGPMIYKSLMHETENRNLSWDRALSIWEQSIDFEFALANAGRFGEVRAAIRAGLEARNFSHLRHLAERKLALRERAAALEETRRLSATGGALTIVLGLLSLPSVLPLVEQWLLPVLGLSTLSQTASFVVSLGLVVLGLSGLLWLSAKVASRNRGVRWRFEAKRE